MERDRKGAKSLVSLESDRGNAHFSRFRNGQVSTSTLWSSEFVIATVYRTAGKNSWEMPYDFMRIQAPRHPHTVGRAPGGDGGGRCLPFSHTETFIDGDPVSGTSGGSASGLRSTSRYRQPDQADRSPRLRHRLRAGTPAGGDDGLFGRRMRRLLRLAENGSGIVSEGKTRGFTLGCPLPVGSHSHVLLDHGGGAS